MNVKTKVWLIPKFAMIQRGRRGTSFDITTRSLDTSDLDLLCRKTFATSYTPCLRTIEIGQAANTSFLSAIFCLNRSTGMKDQNARSGDIYDSMQIVVWVSDNVPRVRYQPKGVRTNRAYRSVPSSRNYRQMARLSNVYPSSLWSNQRCSSPKPC